MSMSIADNRDESIVRSTSRLLELVYDQRIVTLNTSLDDLEVQITRWDQARASWIFETYQEIRFSYYQHCKQSILHCDATIATLETQHSNLIQQLQQVMAEKQELTERLKPYMQSIVEVPCIQDVTSFSIMPIATEEVSLPAPTDSHFTSSQTDCIQPEIDVHMHVEYLPGDFLDIFKETKVVIRTKYSDAKTFEVQDFFPLFADIFVCDIIEAYVDHTVFITKPMHEFEDPFALLCDQVIISPVSQTFRHMDMFCVASCSTTFSFDPRRRSCGSLYFRRVSCYKGKVHGRVLFHLAHVCSFHPCHGRDTLHLRGYFRFYLKTGDESYSTKGE